jgi:Protein of unknown function (DUF3141).
MRLRNGMQPLAEELPMVLPAIEYMTDAAQRTVLFWDVMRQRGNQYREHLAETAPNVLDYSVELVIDGRTLERPVNYVSCAWSRPRASKSTCDAGRL